MRKAALTTIDNPYDPFDEFALWFAYDADQGYHSPSYLGRVVVTSDELSEADQDAFNELAIDEIIEQNPLGIYRKVIREK